MLDLVFDPRAGYYQAPPHFKANNGIFLVDDLGRQLVTPRQLLNRWILPMEHRHDYLMLRNGSKFQIPFDTLLFFSTNMQPAEVADEAFLRRIGYKIFVGEVTVEDYRQILREVCDEYDVPYTDEAFDLLVQQHHVRYARPLLACYPRDLVRQIGRLRRLPRPRSRADARSAALGLAQLFSQPSRRATLKPPTRGEDVMKGTRGLFMLLIAVLAGGAAVMFASRWMQAQAKGGGQIAVAAVDVEIGAKLVPEMLRMVTWPAGNEPPGAFAELAALDGRVVKTSVHARRAHSRRQARPGRHQGRPVGRGGRRQARDDRARQRRGRRGRLRAAGQLRRHHGQHAERRQQARRPGQGHQQDRAGAHPRAGHRAGIQPRRDEAQGGQRGDARSHADAGREPRPRAQRRHAVARAAQPGGPEARRHRRRHQGHDAQGRAPAACRRPQRSRWWRSSAHRRRAWWRLSPKRRRARTASR